MIAIQDHTEDIRNLFRSQSLAALATGSHGQPYASLVAFSVTEALDYLIFSTGRATRKYANLSAEPRVALLIDNRSNAPSDLRFATAVTASGRAEDAAKDPSGPFFPPYLEKHPHMSEFVASPSTALVAVRVEVYYMVTRFQNVIEIHMT